MAKGRISKRTVEAISSGEKDQYLWDSELSGFGVKVTPAGSRIYLIQYRIGGRKGRTRRVRIARHGNVTSDQARKEAKRILGQVAAGKDPAEAKSEIRRDLTVSELCDLYLAEGCIGKKASTIVTDRSNIERHIKRLLGRRRIGSIKRPDVERFQRDIANGMTAADVRTRPRGRAIVSGGKGTAARTVAVLGAIFSFAVNRDLLSENPVKGVKLYPSQRQERFLSQEETARLGEALRSAEAQGTNIYAVAGIRLLLLTGSRKSEIERLLWSQVDLERQCLRLPDSKTGAKAIPLGRSATAVLEQIPRQHQNPHVLPGANGGPYLGPSKVWRQIRAAAGLDDVRLHDLRHSFASAAVTDGNSLYIVGKVLGHRQSRTTEVYAHLADDPVREVADRTSAKIAKHMDTELEPKLLAFPARGTNPS